VTQTKWPPAKPERFNPHCEHDFGIIEDRDVRCIWTTDCYDSDMELVSPDPADPSVSTRVLTVMLAEEY
jgi:hypothetical protein